MEWVAFPGTVPGGFHAAGQCLGHVLTEPGKGPGYGMARVPRCPGAPRFADAPGRSGAGWPKS
eukprot:15470984-Alexandrium_andersonii.AAC.1